jgi:outer membrane protein TolC
VRNQLASKLQVTAAETLLAQAREALVIAQRNRVLAADALAALAGRGADYAAAVAPSRLSLDRLPSMPAILPADLLGRRPDIAASVARIDSAAAGRQAARRAFYPNVNLLAFAGLQALGLSNLVDTGAATGGGGPAISLPIFDGGRLRAEYQGAAAELDLATADYNARVVSAVRETADAITQVQSLAAQRVQADAVVRGFGETRRLNNIRIQSGLESRLDVVDTDIRLLDARLADSNIAAAQADQHVALIVALGGGFDTQQDHK